MIGVVPDQLESKMFEAYSKIKKNVNCRLRDHLTSGLYHYLKSLHNPELLLICQVMVDIFLSLENERTHSTLTNKLTQKVNQNHYSSVDCDGKKDSLDR